MSQEPNDFEAIKDSFNKIVSKVEELYTRLRMLLVERYLPAISLQLSNFMKSFMRILLYLVCGFGLSDTQLHNLRSFLWKLYFPFFMWEMMLYCLYFQIFYEGTRNIHYTVSLCISFCSSCSSYSECSECILPCQCRPDIYILPILYTFMLYCAIFRIPAVFYRSVQAIVFGYRCLKKRGVIPILLKKPAPAQKEQPQGDVSTIA